MTAPAPPAGDRAGWVGRPEAGTAAGIRFVEVVARLCGRRVAHAVVAPIAAWFLLTRATERRASREFLARVHGGEVTPWQGLRHFHAFARVAVDRFFFQSGAAASIPVRVTGQELLQRVLDARRGCIVVSAHLGNFEAARQVALTYPELRLRLLLDRAQNLRLVRTLERVDPRFAANIIDAVGEPQALALRIGAALEAGEWIGWLADRHRPGERTATVDFLGRPVQLPLSPYLVASLYRVPVFLVLAVLENDGYEITVDPLLGDADYAHGSRDTMVAAAVARFGERLAAQARRHPFNWFNFYDFWL